MKSIHKTKTIFFLLLLFVSTMAYSSMIPAITASPDWLGGWDHRRAIDITGSASAGTDYQILLNVLYGSDMQTDFDGVRFTDDDGTTELDYWLEYYNPDAPIIELADYGELSDESSSPDYVLTNVKDGSAFNETSATDIEIWFEVDTTNGFEGFSYAHYLDVDSGTDCDLTAYNFDTQQFVKIDEPLPSTYDWMNGTIYDSDYWNTTHIAFSLFELSGTADFYWDYGEITHSKTARFWVEVADNLDSTQTIYMYYGNDAVSTTSDGHDTFQEFYDKDSTSGWSTTDITVTTSGDYLRFNNPIVGDAGLATRTDVTTSADFQVMARYKTVSLGADALALMLFDGVIGSRYTLTMSPYAPNNSEWWYYDGVSQYGGGYTEGVEYIMTHQIDEGDSATGIDIRLYDTSWSLLDSVLGENFAIGSPTDADGIAIGDSTGGGACDAYFSWIAFRKCIDTEPAVSSFGSEEDSPPIPEWFTVNSSVFIFPVGWTPEQQFGYDMFFIALGLIMIPLSTLYLVRGGMKDMSRDKLFFGLIILLMGLGLLIGGIMP